MTAAGVFGVWHLIGGSEVVLGIGIGIELWPIWSTGIGIGIDVAPVGGIDIGMGLAKFVLSVSGRAAMTKTTFKNTVDRALVDYNVHF